MSLNLAHRLLHLRLNMMHTPVPMTKDFLELLNGLFTAEEAWLVSFMPPLPASARVIALLQFKRRAEVEKTLQDLVQRGLLFDLYMKGEKRFMVPVGIPGFIELQLMRGEDTPRSRKFAMELRNVIRNEPKAFYGKYEKMGSSFARVIPVNQTLSTGKTPLAYEDARSIIMNANRFALVHCYCRQEKALLGEKVCDAPQECCMALNFGADFVIRNNFGREVDRDTMLQKLEEAEKQNMVHMSDNMMGGNNTFMCNCCGCCCGMLGALTKFDEKGPFVNSSMMIALDKEACNDCGKCVKVCNVKALSSINKITVLNKTKCIGCGNCFTICPKNAISAISRPGWQEPPKDYGAMVADLMGRRLAGPFKIGPFKIPFIRNFAAAKINNMMDEAHSGPHTES